MLVAVTAGQCRARHRIRLGRDLLDLVPALTWGVV